MKSCLSLMAQVLDEMGATNLSAVRLAVSENKVPAPLPMCKTTAGQTATTYACGRTGAVASGLLSGGIAGFVAAPLARWRTLLQAGKRGELVSHHMSRPFAGAPAWALRNAGHTACIFHLVGATRRTDAFRDNLPSPAAPDPTSRLDSASSSLTPIMIPLTL